MSDFYMVWNGGSPDKAYKLSGQFSTFVKTSLNIASTTISDPDGIAVDANDTYIAEDSFPEEIYRFSGQFTSTVKSSVGIGSQNPTVHDICVDSAGVGLVGSGGDIQEAHYYSGFITSTLKDSLDVTNMWLGGTSSLTPQGIVFRDTTTIFGVPHSNNAKVYLVSGKFTSTIRNSEQVQDITGTALRDISAYGDGIIVANEQLEKVWKLSGFFSPTIVASLVMSGVDSGAQRGICHDSITETLGNFIQVGAANIITFLHVPNTLTVFQESIVQVLSFVHSLSPITVGSANIFGLVGTVTTAANEFNPSILNQMFLNGQVNTTIAAGAVVPNQTLTLVGTVTRGYTVSNTIDFAGALSGHESIAPTGTLTLVGTVTTAGTINRSLINTLDLTGVLAGYKEGQNLYEYEPLGTLDPSRGSPSTVTLQDNSPTPVNTITLRNPDFGNTETLEIFRALNVSRSRKKAIFRESEWPQNRSINFSFSAISAADGASLLTFLSATVGDKIQLIDWESRIWLGVITNPDAVILDHGTCKYKFTLNFVGEIIGTVNIAEFLVSVTHTFFVNETLGFDRNAAI